MLHSPEPSPIRPARPEDADAIYALKAAAFGDTFLPFTIYQDRRSARYLRQIIEGADGQPSLVVLVEAERVVGYYQPVFSADEAILSYIATAADVRGRGAGSALLEHFEAAGAARGCRHAALDVFESNHRACAWYSRRGYLPRLSRYLLRLPVESLAGARASALSWEAPAFSAALSRESELGFGKVECRCGAGQVSLGLIGGHTWNLLQCRGVSALDAARAVAQTFGRERTHLIAGLTEAPLGWPPCRVEVALRLERPLGA